MKLIWCSDIHLNFLREEWKRVDFYTRVKESEGDIVVVSGDIAESHNVAKLVAEMESYVQKPVLFILGNHDFYGSSVAAVKRSVNRLAYLPSRDYVLLNASTALLGVDGWGDCRNGDFENSRLTMSDWLHIEDLKKGYLHGMDKLKVVLQSLADKDASLLAKRVKLAIKDGFKRIIIVTHVPPFEEASLHAGRKSTPDGLPFFSSQILGSTILPIAKKNPGVDFLWLSGHTHSRVEYKACANMVCKVAKAEYYYPQIEEILNVD